MPVFGMNKDQPSVAKLSSGDYTQNRCGEDIFLLRCTMIDWDGENFGCGYQNFTIDSFGGTAKITQLPAFPFNYHPKLDQVRAELIKRGKAFEALSGYHYKLYHGNAIGQGPWGPIKYSVRPSVETR